MTTPDDHFRDYYRTVTPTAFPPCPTPPANVPSYVAAGLRSGAWLSRTALTLAAGLLLAFGLTQAPSGTKKSPTGETDLLKDATAKGKSLGAPGPKK